MFRYLNPDLSPAGRRWAAAGAILFCIVVIGSAFAIMGGRFAGAFRTAGRARFFLASLAGLLAVSFFFLEIMTGSFRPLLLRAFQAKTMRKAHVTFGLLGLAFVLGHLGLLITRIHWATENKVFFLFGPIALGLLIITIITALLRNRLRKSWAWLHLLNYIIFVLAVFHGLVIGAQGAELAMRVIFGIFLAMALVGLAYRASFADWRARFRRTAGRGA